MFLNRFCFCMTILNFLGVHSFLLQFTNIFLQASLSHENIEFYSNSPTNEEKVFYIYIKNISSASAFVCYFRLFVILIEQHLRKNLAKYLLLTVMDKLRSLQFFEGILVKVFFGWSKTGPRDKGINFLFYTSA